MTTYRQSALTASVVAGIFFAVFSIGTVERAHAVQVDLDNGETIELDSDVVSACLGEGLNLGACACVVSVMLEAEGRDRLSLSEMTRLANTYPDIYRSTRAHCISVN